MLLSCRYFVDIFEPSQREKMFGLKTRGKCLGHSLEVEVWVQDGAGWQQPEGGSSDEL